MARDVLFQHGGEIATLTLNRPDKRNALTPAMIEEMCDAMTRLRDDLAVRVVVVRGNGPAFCAGLDLTEMAKQRAEGEGGQDRWTSGHRDI